MLVLETSITRSFIEALETLSPSQESKILHFVCELLKNANSYEVRIRSLTEQLEALMNQLENFEETDKETDTEESAYEDTDEEETNVD